MPEILASFSWTSPKSSPVAFCPPRSVMVRLFRGRRRRTPAGCDGHTNTYGAGNNAGEGIVSIGGRGDAGFTRVQYAIAIRVEEYRPTAKTRFGRLANAVAIEVVPNHSANGASAEADASKLAKSAATDSARKIP